MNRHVNNVKYVGWMLEVTPIVLTRHLRLVFYKTDN